MPERSEARREELELEVRAALRTDPGTAALADATLVVEPGGVSNHAWRASLGGGRYFVRLSPPDSARLGVDRASECRLLHVAAAAGLAPEVVRCDPDRRLLVTRHVQGRALSRAEASAPRVVEQVGRALRRLHSLPAPPALHRVDFALQARNLEPQCAARSIAADALRASAALAFGCLHAAGRRDTLCHNDLHHLNLVDDGDRLWFVDWEYGGTGDPVFDFASFLCQHDCGPDEVATLRAAYGAQSAPDAAQLRAACWAFDYVQWVWYRAWPTGDGDDPVYAERADALERRLLSTRPV